MSPHEVAADWLIRLQAAPTDSELSQAFESWLNESERHRDAYARVVKSWQLMGEAAASPRPEAHARPRSRPTSVRPSPARRRWRPIAIAAGLAACFLAIVAYPSLRLMMMADYRTGTGITQSLTLEDGTRVALGAGSAIAVDVTADRRAVRLLQGEAFFDVRRDPSRPFVVDAGGVDVRVLGTSFNVRLSSADAVVELAEGAVDLQLAGREGVMAQLLPGQSAMIDLATGALTRGEISPEDIASWREGRLFVVDTTIAEVVEQLQRYHSAWIALPDGALASERVTGLYDLSDPDRALRALVEPHGGQMRAISPYARILSRF